MVQKRLISNLLGIGAAMAMVLSPFAASAQSDDHGVPEPELVQPEAPPEDGPPASPPVETSSAEAPAAPVLQPAPDISVTDSRLFAILTDPGGTDSVTPTASIPYVVGRSCYNWALKFDPVEGDLILTEELVLPGPARNWGTGGDRTEVDPQRSRAVTERHFDGRSGVAEAGWCVAKDDPVGAYRYVIRQGDREVARFDFTVGDLL